MKSFKQLRIDINESAWTRKEGKKKSNNTGDDRLSKSLRAWNC